MQSPATPPAPPAPPAPAPPASPSTGAEVAGLGAPAQPLAAVPRTAQEMRALRSRRSELSSQLTSAEGRRERLVRRLERSDTPAERAGLEQHIQLLDQRILQLERDIAETGRQVAAAPAELFATSEVPRFQLDQRGATYNVSGATMFVSLFLLLPIVVAATRLLWRRGSRQAAPPVAAASPEDSARLHRLEEAVDAIAVEVERISEGQRFVTQLLAEQRQTAALGRGPLHEDARVLVERGPSA